MTFSEMSKQINTVRCENPKHKSSLNKNCNDSLKNKSIFFYLMTFAVAEIVLYGDKWTVVCEEWIVIGD
jgi:hypothetical protein